MVNQIQDATAKLKRAEENVSRLNSKVAKLTQELADKAVEARQSQQGLEQRHSERVQQLQTLHETEMDSRMKEHELAMEATKRLHREEMTSLRERQAEGLSLRELNATVADTAQNLQKISMEVRQQRNQSEEERLAQLIAREKLVSEMERNARLTRQRAEDEYQRLLSMIATLETSQERLRSGHEEERVRLSEEHARLDALQVTLKTESELLRSDVSKGARRSAMNGLISRRRSGDGRKSQGRRRFASKARCTPLKLVARNLQRTV